MTLAADWSIAVGYWIVFHCLSINGNVRIRINVSYPHSQIEAPTLNVLSHSQIEALTFNVLSHFAMVTMGLTSSLQVYCICFMVTQQWLLNNGSVTHAHASNNSKSYCSMTF